MRVRFLVALIVVLGATAFAPAPFPKPARRGDSNSISIESLQGDWKAVSFDTVAAGDQLNPIGLWFQQVRIKGDRWSYLVNGNEHLSYRLVIGGDKRPAAIDYYEIQGNPERPGMVGIARREGNRVTILYYATGPESRPKAFKGMPSGWWLLVLERK